MIPINKKVFDTYFKDRYTYFENKFRYPYIDHSIKLRLMEVEILRLKNVITGLLKEYENNVISEEALYYFEENIIPKSTDEKNNVIIKTNNIAKIFLFLFEKYEKLDLFGLWMDNINYKIQKNINSSIYDITLTDYIGTKYLKILLNNTDKISALHDEEILCNVFSYKKFYFNEEAFNQELRKRNIIGCRNPKINLPTVYKNDSGEEYFNLLELLQNFYSYTDGLKLLKCSMIQI
jgi:hypothetical protein